MYKFLPLLAMLLLVSVARAQLPDGTYPTTDTHNGNTGSAVGGAGNSLNFTYTDTSTNPSTTHVVKLMWDAAADAYVAGPNTRFWTAIVGETTYYWYQVRANPDALWVTESSGTL